MRQTSMQSTPKSKIFQIFYDYVLRITLTQSLIEFLNFTVSGYKQKSVGRGA